MLSESQYIHKRIAQLISMRCIIWNVNRRKFYISRIQVSAEFSVIQLAKLHFSALFGRKELLKHIGVGNVAHTSEKRGAMDLKLLQQQYQGTTLPKLIQHQMKAMSSNVMLYAIADIIKTFPVGFQPTVKQFSTDYPQSAGWFVPNIILTKDLSFVFADTISEMRSLSAKNGVALNDDQLFNGFNYAVLSVSIFMHAAPDVRKQFGIKLGWFS